MSVEVFERATDAITQLLAETVDKAQTLFHDAAKDYFHDRPALKSFRWYQYTPYWNDGEACEFHVGSDVSLNESDSAYPDEEEVEEIGLTEEQWEEYSNDLSKFISSFSDDDMLFMFGDHSDITVAADSITVDYYDHD